MRKVWITKRAGIDGSYVEWYDDNHRRRSKYFSPEHKKYIQIFKTRKFSELNSDVRPIGACIDITWNTLETAYLKQKAADRISPGTLVDIKSTLAAWKSIIHPISTANITIDDINTFKSNVVSRYPKRKRNQDAGGRRIDGSDGSLPPAGPTPPGQSAPPPPAAGQSTDPVPARAIAGNTVNKHLRNLRAMFRWAASRGFMQPLAVKMVKTVDKPVRVLTNDEIARLFRACGTDRQWAMRILLALTTGLRASDIDAIELGDIDIDRRTITRLNGKTGKISLMQPLPDAVMPRLTSFILEEVPAGQVRLLKYRYSKHWLTLCKRAGIGKVKFHDLRRTFGSLQASAGVPIKALQEMYNHASIETTMRYYIRTGETEKRAGVNTLRVEEWL